MRSREGEAGLARQVKVRCNADGKYLSAGPRILFPDIQGEDSTIAILPSTSTPSLADVELKPTSLVTSSGASPIHHQRSFDSSSSASALPPDQETLSKVRWVVF
jgi:hypothetical protein